MNKIKTWFADNKGPSVFASVFVILAGVGGWFAYGSWDDYSAATQTYSDAAAKLAKLAKQSPPPNEANLSKLGKTIDDEQTALNQLLGTLHQYVISPFASLEKAKSQDAPQLLQDALRAQVTKLKGAATANGATLPSGFYLALDEYENRLPAPDDAISLAKQLTVFNWISEHLISHPGLIIAEFSKVVSAAAQNPKTDRKALPSISAPKSELSYESPATLKLSFRCDQGSLREILNSFSQSPYFLVIDSLQLQNTVTEPPRRDSAGQQPAQPPSGAPQDGQSSGQRIPIVVGREQINASLRIRVLEFPDRQQNPPKAAK
jgi:hypothetical protein